MPRVSPTLEGFRIAFRRPSLTVAEIAWRWSVGGAAVLLFAVALIDYLDTLPVSNLNADLLATRQVLLVWRALAHIFRGSLNRAMLAALFGLLALSLLWIIVASLGRFAIVRALIECYRASASSGTVGAVNRDASNRSSSRAFAAFRSLFGLNFLRVAATLAALLALLGAAMVANLASSEARPQTALAFLIFLFLAVITAIIWMGLNWLLSFASILVVGNGEDTLGAISATLGPLKEHSGPVLAVGTWNTFAHLASFVGAGAVASILLLFISIVPARLIVGGIVLVALAYFAVADWLYIARLAAYVCIVEMPEAFSSSAISSVPPAPGGERPTETPAQTAVDRDELILSDPPGMAFQLATEA